MELRVQNANRERVMAVIDRFLKERDGAICCCPRCINDIAAIALNYLPPHYFVDTNDNRDNGSPWIMVETAVVDAIDRVTVNPNHPHQRQPLSS
jgi:competence protein ComFB